MTVSVTMIATRMGEDGDYWEAGTSHDATDGFARYLVQYGWASATFPRAEQSAPVQFISITTAEVAAGEGVEGQSYIIASGETGEGERLIFTSTSNDPTPSFRYWSAPTVVYGGVPATWYAGEVNSVVTATLKADGDLSTATDQVPQKWRIVINADDDVAAAQRLLEGTPNVYDVLPGDVAQFPVVGSDGLPEAITSIYAVCICTGGAPANYTGGTYVLSSAETDITDSLAMMARVDFSGGLGAGWVRLVASSTYSTNYSDLAVSVGVTA